MSCVYVHVFTVIFKTEHLVLHRCVRRNVPCDMSLCVCVCVCLSRGCVSCGDLLDRNIESYIDVYVVNVYVYMCIHAFVHTFVCTCPLCVCVGEGAFVFRECEYLQ